MTALTKLNLTVLYKKGVSEGHIYHEKLERYQRLVEEASEQTEIRNRQNRKLR